MKNSFSLLLGVLLLLGTQAVYAQIGPPPPGGGAPVDGGASLLVAAGIAYGAKKLRDSRRNRKTNNTNDQGSLPS
ncbi:MAG: hypothetical protein GC205_11120 [Bacteroidetes bacterium]|nr:hypothetical protein [Bacteroidota bacterium]